MITAADKSGIIEFKNQKDIIADRRKKTEQQYQDLKKRVGKIVQNNHYLAQSVITNK